MRLMLGFDVGGKIGDEAASGGVGFNAPVSDFLRSLKIGVVTSDWGRPSVDELIVENTRAEARMRRIFGLPKAKAKLDERRGAMRWDPDRYKETEEDCNNNNVVIGVFEAEPVTWESFTVHNIAYLDFPIPLLGFLKTH